MLDAELLSRGRECLQRVLDLRPLIEQPIQRTTVAHGNASKAAEVVPEFRDHFLVLST